MKTLHSLLERQAKDLPNSIISVINDDSITYSELNTMAAKVAHQLNARGIKPGSKVLIHLNRSFELLACIFGVLKVGAVCIPVDTEDSDTRVNNIVELSDSELIITNHTSPQLLSEKSVAVSELLTSKPDDEKAESFLFSSTSVSEDDISFVFYTSGSTGVPKGVVLSHKALYLGQDWLAKTFPLSVGDKQLFRTTISVTNLVREVFWPILHGGTIVIVPEGSHSDPQKLATLINQQGVSTVLGVPALISALLELDTFTQSKALKHVFCSSDVMPGDIAQKFFASELSGKLYNLYGLTEAFYCSYFECKPEDQYDGFVPVGVAAALTPVVVNENLTPVSAGEVGELIIGGESLSSGYYGKPELTQEKFIQTPDGVFFKTGDLASIDQGGNLTLLGRIDNQVKISGYRVEIGEVEHALRSIPAIKHAYVVGKMTDEGHKRLAAYVVFDEDQQQPSGTSIRDALNEKLPKYMVPAVFYVVDDIPMTHNGKIDRKKLEESPSYHLEMTESYTAPSTELEKQLCEMWQSTLELDKVGIHDNFFSLGGDSIQGFLISAKANQLGYKVPGTQLFNTPTISELALFIESSIQDEHDSDQETITSISNEVLSAYPLTDMQKGMLFHSELDPDSGVYFEQFIYGLKGDINLEAYEEAWQKVVDRHGILRCAITTDDNHDPIQRIQDQAQLEFYSADLTEQDDTTQTESIEAFLKKDRYRGFNIDEAPMFRLSLFKLSDEKYRFIMSYHHLILDAWSLFILLSDALEYYRSVTTDSEPQLGETLPFCQYVQHLDGENWQEAKHYWDNRLAGFKSPTIISKQPELGLSASHIDEHAEARLDLTVEQTNALKEFGKRHQLTLNTLVQASWALIVAKHSRLNDICFGITITHRPVDLTGIESMVGICINSLPMRVSLPENTELLTWLDSIQKSQVSAREYDYYPLPNIQRDCEVKKGQPLFETLLIFENFPRTSDWSEKAGIKVKQERYVGYTNYPLAIEAMPEDNLFFQVKYDEAFFSAEKIDELLGDFHSMLVKVASSVTLSLTDLIGVELNAPSLSNDVLEQNQPEVVSSDTNHHTEEKALLEEIWKDILNVDDIDPNKTFLSLGGNSLLAMRCINICEQHDLDIELKDLFEPNSTLNTLAKQM